MKDETSQPALGMLTPEERLVEIDGLFMSLKRTLGRVIDELEGEQPWLRSQHGHIPVLCALLTLAAIRLLLQSPKYRQDMGQGRHAVFRLSNAQRASF